MYEPTMTFSAADERDSEMRESLTDVYKALKEKGYNPTNQIVGYLLSEDPTYITTNRNARSIMTRMDRDDLLAAMIEYFVNH